MRFPLFGGALFLAAACIGPVGAADPPRPTPTCAFLDPERAPRAALLEAKLLAEPSVAWVERAGIDKVLKEQALQALFSPQGGADRARLGKLLKADLLVLVRPVKEAKEPAFEVVLSDTVRGLRLLVRAVAVTNDAEADAAALRDAFRAGLKKFQEDVHEVVAVPPFASTNLGYEYEHLKGAYAKLVEQAALANPGVVVVELAEAEAIAQEIKLTDPGATVKRAPPLYLLGEFRRQGAGAEAQVALKLRATRGGQPVGKLIEHTADPGDAPAVLHKWVADRLADGKAAPAPALEPKTEAKQLAELSRSRQRVGDWADALALLEASLLLHPNQPELNADAMAILRLRMEQLLGRGKKDLDLLRRAAQLHRRGFEHLEALVASGARLARYTGPNAVRGGRMFYSPFPFPHRLPPYSPLTPQVDPPEVRELVQQLERERQAICLRLLALVVKDGSREDVIAFTHIGLWELPPAKRYPEYTRLILQYQEFPAMTSALDALTYLSPHTLTLEELPAYRQMLDQLEKEGNAGVRAAAGKARLRVPDVEKETTKLAEQAAEQKRLAEEAKHKPPVLPNKAPVSREEKLARLEKHLEGGPLRALRLKTEPAEDDWFLDHLQGVVAAGKGIDVFWAWGFFLSSRSKEVLGRPKPGYGSGQSGPVLLVMKEKGLLRRVWEKPGAPDRFSAVCFDGRYVWVATERSGKAPALYVLDPAAEKVYEVTAADGLPQPPEGPARDPHGQSALSLRLAALEQGRVCVAGGFGRGWVATAVFDPAREKVKVSVIHEAREASNQGDKDAWLNPSLAFTPTYALVLRGQPGADGKARLRVLIGRRAGQGTGNVDEVSGHPLVVDPDRPAANVMKDFYFASIGQGPAGAPDGSARVVQWSTAVGKMHLLRIDYPGAVRDLGELALPLPSGDVVTAIKGDRLQIVVGTGVAVPQPGGGRAIGSSWWTADLDGKNLRKTADGQPPARSLAHSSHYGLVVLLDLVPGLAFCEVEVRDSKP
jgi:tetratricopeptide (TPR) repeat protein